MKESPDDIIRRLAYKHDLDIKQVRDVCSHPFRFTANYIRTGATDKTIMIPYFGKFQVKPFRLKKEKEKNNGNKTV